MRYYLLNFYLGRVALAALMDLAAFLLAATATWFVVAPPVALGTYAAAMALGGIAAFVLLYYTEAYGLTVLGSGRKTFACVTVALGVAAGATLAAQVLLDFSSRTLQTIAHTGGLYFLLLLAGRLVFRLIASRPSFSRRVLIVGTSDLGRAIARAVRQRRNLGAEIAGFLSDDLDDQGAWIEGYPVLGRVHEIEKVLERDEVGRIVVASKRRQEYFPAEELLFAKLAGRKVESGVSFYERVTGQIYLRELRPSYLIFSGGFHGGRLAAGAKRSLDFLVAGIGLLCAAPVLALAALAVRLDSPGPALFGQERVGVDGRVFRIWKLRSMRQDAELETGAVFSDAGDDRVTRVGRFLRMARLDEIPQLWNVLRGDMSLVGPRPERPEFVERLSSSYPYFRLRCAVKPGITGWAQTRNGYVSDVSGYEEKLALDLYYLKYRSFTMDLLILWKTIKTIVLLQGI